MQNDAYIDKQVYRDGGSLNKVTSLYEYVSHVTERFRVPTQQVIFWQTSGEEDLARYLSVFQPYANEKLTIVTVTDSQEDLQNLLKETPETVIIMIGDEPDSVPFLKTTVPIIRDSSDAEESVMIALRILAMRNPLLYMKLRMQQEN